MKRRNWRRSKYDCMSSMISETSWLPLPSRSAISPRTFHAVAPTVWPADAEGFADLVGDPAADLVLRPRGRLQSLDQRAPLQVGQDAVEFVGDLLELRQQIALLFEGLVQLLLLGSLRRRALGVLWLAHEGRHGQPLRRRSPLALTGFPLERLVGRRVLRGFHVDDARDDGLVLLRAGIPSLGCPVPVARICPAIMVRLAGGGVVVAIFAGAWAACLSRSETVGIRLPAMSLRIWSISAHFSRWPTPNSGFRMAWRTRSSPETTRPESRRPFCRSADAWFSMRRRVSGSIQLFGCQGPQLLVGLVELELLVADVDRLAMPAAQLLGQPDGVLLGREHEEGVGRRNTPARRPGR